MSTLSVTISRVGLDLDDLVIVDHPHGLTDCLWIPADGISSPGFSWRLDYAPDSSWIPGKQLMAAVLEASSIPLTVYAQGSSEVFLDELQRELEAAVSQFTYTTTITVDGVSRAWQCDPAFPQWGAIRHEYAEKHLAQAALVIPVNP